MKTLKIPVWWSTEEAENILLFLDELRSVIGHLYGEEIQQMHRALQQAQNHPAHEDDWNDEVPF